MSFRLLPPAIEDMYGLEDWVAENFGTKFAAKTHNELIAAFQSLVRFPHLGQLRPDITSESLRFFLSGHYYIVYRPGSPLLIHRIIHTTRDIAALMQDR